MSQILCYMPTYSPFVEADTQYPRSYERLNNPQIQNRIVGSPIEVKAGQHSSSARKKPWVYFDAIDSVLNTNPNIDLIVADGKSTDSVRDGLIEHQRQSGGYRLELFPDKMSQWAIFNELLNKYATPETEYFVYTSSDVIWQMDWVSEAIKEFEKNPKIKILYPCVNNGDPNLPCQIAAGPRNLDLISPPYQEAAKAPVINAYAMIFRMDFLREYGGYPTIFRNCYSESFLHYMCKAVGGEQYLMPRGWCFHWGTVDIWQENGSYYHYNEDIVLFRDLMTKVKMMEGMGSLTKEFLKNLLYKK